jgi:hypothetical protein
MAEADRIAAALRYQQELDNAQRPAFGNPNMLAQGRKMNLPERQAYSAETPDWMAKGLPMEGRATILPFRDTESKKEIALPGLIASALNSMTAPGRAFSGSDPTFDPMSEGIDFALNTMGGGMAATKAAPVPAGSLGMFIGKTAKNWDSNAAIKALEMEKAGVDPKMIWQETGTWKGPEGQWRQEISDLPSKMTETVHNDIMSKHYFNDPMSKALTHEQLYQNYPDLGKINTTVTAWPNPKGSYSELRNEIEASGPSSMTQRSTALHELQHVIQRKEEFAKGGSPEMFKPHDVFSTKALEDAAILDKTIKANNFNQLEAKNRFKQLFNREPEPGAFAALERIGTGKDLDAARDAARLADKPIESYRRLAGETEARATQKRRNMTTEERRAKFPVESYDVPINQLIIRQ